MKVKCPVCQKEGSLQQRYNSVRVGHYKGFEKTSKGHTTNVEWHSTTLKDVLSVNRDRGLMVNNSGRIVCLPTENHSLPSKHQIMSLAP